MKIYKAISEIDVLNPIDFIRSEQDENFKN